jgi:DNA-binding IclR family transcriptional regulator
VLLAQLPALHAMKITWDIGVRTAMYYSAPGKVFLAFADEAEGMRLLDQQELLAATPQTITDRNQMLAELGEVLRQGYATDRGEFFEGIHCVAAPVRGFDDEVVAAITITGPAHRLPESDFPRLAELTIQAAGDLTERFRTP